MRSPWPVRWSVLWLALLPAQLAAQADAAAARRKPNIVHIMADELGYYELSCMGHPHIATPHLDDLARRGVRFTQALAGSSLCAPTRCCLMTGKHSGHTSVRSNGGGTPMREGEVTVATVLKAAGYATGGYGKWGCGGRGSTGVPEKHGFDEFVGYYDQVHAHSYYPPYIVRNSEEVPLPGNHGGREGATYSHHMIMDAAVSFIRANKDRPFYCYLPVTPPHGMFDLPDRDPAWAQYGEKPWPLEARRYAAMVTMLDRQIGELVGLLRKLGLEEDTLVLFTGDNGGNDYFADREHPRGFHAPNVDPRTGVAFRGRKGNLYEGGLRVPMLACWPGRIAPGRVSDHPLYFPDVLPTFAELAGGAAPDDIDGISFVPELLGAAAAGREQRTHEFLYWELGGQTAVRMGTWKGVRRARGAWELYDLATDVSEAKDVAAAHADVVARIDAFASKAHEPVREGTYSDRALHEKDRRAKWGDTQQPRRGARGGGRAAGAVHALPTEGLIPRAEFRIHRASSENGGKAAINVLDGDPRTHWHTRFGDRLDKHPHELVIDMGAVHEVRGLAYLARQDRGWNGAAKDLEFWVGDVPDGLGAGNAAGKATLKKVKVAQTIDCPPVRGRYVLVRIGSEVNGGPWSSAAEIGVVGK